jgi:hypothetical protein
MGFLRNLFRKSKTDSRKSESGITAELYALCREYSHPEYPLLRVGYSPSSRYPAVDFTSWIAQKLTEHRFNDIAYLLTQLTSANPGVNVGPEYWNDKALELCNLDLSRFLQSDDPQASLELHAALFLYILHGTFDGFMLINHVDFLARVMSPYAFSVPHLETKIKAANQFIRKMRKETQEHSTAWVDYPLLNVEDLDVLLTSPPPASALRAKLREVSIGARQLFFGALKDGAGQGYWIARPYGIDERKVRLELADAGLGELQDDPMLVLMTYSKGELLEALEGYPIKKGWNKKYIAKYMKESTPEILAKLTRGKTVLALQAGIFNEGEVLASWIDKTKVLLAIALGFTV